MILYILRDFLPIREDKTIKWNKISRLSKPEISRDLMRSNKNEEETQHKTWKRMYLYIWKIL